MIPSKSDPRWIAIIKGETPVNFKSFSGNMLINRLARSLEKDASASNVSKCLDEAYSFFTKFENVFRDELTILFK